MSELRDTIAQAVGDHRYSLLDSPVSHCVCGFNIGRGYDALDNHRADAVLAALQTGGWELVKLPESPSEYWGPQHQPQWNHYPFTRVDGDEIEIGARCEHVFRVNVAEARIFAADILAATQVVEVAP